MTVNSSSEQLSGSSPWLRNECQFTKQLYCTGTQTVASRIRYTRQREQFHPTDFVWELSLLVLLILSMSCFAITHASKVGDRGSYKSEDRWFDPSWCHYLLIYLHTNLLTSHLLIYLFTYLLTCLLTYLLTCFLTYLLTYLLTPWSRVLLEKLIGFQLVKKFPTFMELGSSLPHSQVHATCPILSQLDPLHIPITLPEDPF